MLTTDLDALTGTRVLKTLGLWLVMAVAVCVASWYGLYWLMPSWRETATPTLVLVAEAYALLPIAAAIVFNGVGSMARAVRFIPTSGRYILLAVGVWAGMLCVLFGLYTAFGALSGSLWHPVIDFVRHASDMSRLATATPTDWALIVIRAVALAGLTEELLFRGLLFGWLRPRLGFAATILVTSVLFALMHYFVILAPGVFLYSLVAGWLRELSGSVLPALVMHILTDTAMLVAATVLVANHLS